MDCDVRWGSQLYRVLGLVVVVSVGFALRSNSIADDVVMNPRLDDVMQQLRVDRVRDVWSDPSFQCIAWRATKECNPNGARSPSKDLGCDARITHKMAGYCEVRNRTSGEIFHVMATTCRSVDDDVTFTCNMARDFTDFSILAARYNRPPHIAFDQPAFAPKNGIVMSIYDSVLPSAYAVVRTLRLLGCKLAVEMWYRREQINPMNPMIQELVSHHNCHLREIFEPSATHFHTKPYAIYYSAFENVLFLDSDNIPAKDPTYLFDSEVFKSTGAIFWPDFWHPNNTLFNIHKQSLLWQILDMPFVDMFEQESGQILINKTKSQAALNKLMYYSGHAPRLLDQLELVWGDKDLYRLAWLNTSTPFYMESRPPSLGGLYDPASQYFCGVAMLQYDMNGELLFFHRNTVKLTGSPWQMPVITHVQKFAGSGSYHVDIQGNRMGQSSCFFLTASSEVTPIQDTKHATLEEIAIQFSIQGSAMASQPDFSLWRTIVLFAQKLHMSVIALVGIVFVSSVFCFANIAMVRLTIRKFKMQQFAGAKRKNSIPVV